MAKYRRPILSKSVIKSLAAICATTPATDQNELGLRYLRQLVAFETMPETIAKRYAQSVKMQNAE